MNRATLRIGLEDNAAAEAAAAALAPDNDGFLAANVDGAALVLTSESTSALGLLRSLDDAMGCLRATGIE